MSQHKYYTTAVSAALALCLMTATAAYAEERPDDVYEPIPDWVTSFTIGGPNTQITTERPSKQTTEVSDGTPNSELSIDADSDHDFSYDLDSFAAELLRLTNEARDENGLPPLKTDDSLSEMAQQRMDESEGRHTRPDGTGFYTIFDEYETSLKPTGENIASAAGTPENMVNGWMGSEGHRANLLNPDATYIGIGVAWSDTVIGPRIAGLQLFAK